MINQPNFKKLIVFGAYVALVGLVSCSSSTTTTPSTPSTAYTATVLVADTLGFGAAHIDPTFTNGWGIAVYPQDGAFWLSSNHGGGTNNYDHTGTTALAPIAVPSRNGTDPGSPTGVIVINSADFNHARFVYATEDGVIASWRPSAMLKSTISPNPTAVYKGLATTATATGSNLLYVTDFHNDTIDVYDFMFNPIPSKFYPFIDSGSPPIPATFAPFGIQNIGGSIYVTYAKKLAPDNHDDEPGAGNGYVSIFTTNGKFVRRFASQGKLNSPWGVAAAPSTFGQFKNAILISNFGDGTISGYDSSGTFLGQISKDVNSTPLSINGLWGITFTNSAGGNDPNALYFTAGPGGEKHGLFGYIKMK